MPREIITFQCQECKNRNYTSTKNKKTTTERLEMKKFSALLEYRTSPLFSERECAALAYAEVAAMIRDWSKTHS